MEANTLVQNVREKIRNSARITRDIKRSEENDSLRLGLGEIKTLISEIENITEKDVTGLCSRIKRRKHASQEDIYRLSTAFLQSNENITTFAKVPGALQIIVKELTGQDSEQQIRAAETLCNLSLGDSVVCEKIILQAGSYLITYLGSVNNRLKQTCLWIIINVVASNDKGLQTLLTMGVIPILCELYYSRDIENQDMIQDASTCLDLLFSFKSYQDLRSQNIDCTIFFNQIDKKGFGSPGSEFHMKIIFNSSVINSDFIFSESQMTYLANFLAVSILNCKEISTQQNTLQLLYSIRTLSNIINIHQDTFLKVFIQVCSNLNCNLSELFNRLFELSSKELSSEIFWLLKNTTTVLGDSIETQNLIEKLKIPCFDK